ncbi:MAG: 2-oxoacid:acceptor oxidoreductase subunit alpha [Candidatus Heimdallarchaeaceae archaeon]
MSDKKENTPMVNTGEYFTSGNLAVAEGSLAAGCKFFGGYPITPSSEVAEHMSIKLPQTNGHFVQFEDEIASIASILGASWGGWKSMTATSGPGYSLMLENIGLGIMTETPCIIVNVQRGGPSTGLPTLVGQQDIQQARWGSHGDYEIIALSPNSVQECFDLAITAFNLAEEYRVPVTILMDETIGHMSEKLIIPEEDKIKIVNRKKPTDEADGHLPYKAGEDLIPPMAVAGEGYNVMTTGLTHDERGYPALEADAQEVLLTRLLDKIRKNKDKIIMLEEYMLDDAEFVIVSFGISSRAAKGAVNLARKKGLKAGYLRLITIWPFPDEQIDQIAEKVKAIFIAEINSGQVTREVQRVVKGKAEVHGLLKLGGAIHTPAEIVEEIERRMK